MLSTSNVGGQFFRISAAGVVTEVPLRGVRVRGSGVIPDGRGQYLVSSLSSKLFRVAQSGETEEFAVLMPGSFSGGLSRNPNTGEIVVALNFNTLVRISPDGKTVDTLLANSAFLPALRTVIAEKEK